MLRWGNGGGGAHRRNGHRHGQENHTSEVERRRRDAEAALREAREKTREVERVSNSLRSLREDDNFARLFGDALGGA